MEKARDELERLARDLQREEQKERLKKKLKDEGLGQQEREELERELEKLEKEGKGLDAKDREELQKQIEDMKEMVERLSRKKEDLEAELREMEANGEIDKEELERELEELNKNELTDEERKELEELAKELAECEQCMKQGKCDQAANRLAKAAKKCNGMCKGGGQAERQRMLARMQAVRKALNRQMAQGGPGGPAAGKRPEAKGDTDKEETLVKGEWGKGKVQVVGEGPKGGKRFDGPRKPAEMKEEIKQAGQEAAAAIDRQRLPPSARKMARDYFDRVGGQDKGKDAKKP
jgi:DNA repair exonuclease SbcCD ATPase subunit